MSPYDRMIEIYEDKAELFRFDPAQKIVGLNTYGSYSRASRMRKTKGQDEAVAAISEAKTDSRRLSHVPNRVDVLVACAVSFFMFGLTSSIIGPTIVDLSAAVGISIAAAGLLRSGRQVGQFLGFLMFGRAADQYDLRWLALLGGLVMALGLILVFQGGIVIAISACLIWGLGHSTFNLAPQCCHRPSF